MTDQDLEKSISSKTLAMVVPVVFLIFLLAALYNWQNIRWYEACWLLALIAQGAIRGPFAKKNAKNTVISRHKSGSETAMLIMAMVLMCFLPLIYLSSVKTVFAFADYTAPKWLIYLGVALIVPGLWLFWRSHVDLGRNWSPTLEIRDQHELVTHGVYQYIRHPMYAAIWLLVFSQPCLLHNWIAGFSVIPAFLLMYIVRVPREEDMVRRQFGATYDDYVRQTGRIWPKFETIKHQR